MSNKTYSFETQDAEKYGLDSAVMLYNLRFWLNTNKANKANIHDGFVWTYNSTTAFVQLFPFWNEQKIWRILSKLEKLGVIKSGNYNKASYDRTKWYTIVDEFAVKASLKAEETILHNQRTHPLKMKDASLQSEGPIPDSKPYSNPLPNPLPKLESQQAARRGGEERYVFQESNVSLFASDPDVCDFGEGI